MSGMLTMENQVLVEAREAPILVSGVQSDSLPSMEKLAYVLSMLVKGKAQLIIRSVAEKNNGFEMWRCLCRRYARQDDQSVRGLLKAILNFKCRADSPAGVIDSLSQFDLLVQEYQMRSRTEVQDMVLKNYPHRVRAGPAQDAPSHESVSVSAQH